MKGPSALKMTTVKRFLAPTVVASLAIVVASACGAKKDGPPAPQTQDAAVIAGFELAKKQACFGCHKVQGEGGTRGPSFDTNDSPKDDAHLRESITDPDAQITDGYPKGVMSSAMTGKKLTDQQLDDMVAYLKFVHK
jgi:mono/diheme cytochrome c family protein